VLPLVEAQAHVRLTHDPDGRAAMGGSSGGAVSLIMAWFIPSGTTGCWLTPAHGSTSSAVCRGLSAWGVGVSGASDTGDAAQAHPHWMEVGDKDLYNPNAMRDGMHDWVLANEQMAAVLAKKKYHYQFVFAEKRGMWTTRRRCRRCRRRWSMCGPAIGLRRTDRLRWAAG